MKLQNLNYPLDFKFKISTISSDFNITDRLGNDVAYVRQKLFKLKEDVVVFNNPTKTQELFRIRADRWLDFNASYGISDPAGNQSYGRLTRKGMRSIWKAHYDILDNGGHAKFSISEDNAWVKVLDGLISEIPVVGMFTGYFLNPTYSVKDISGREFFKLKKIPSLVGRRFTLDRLVDIDDSDESLVILSLLMMVLLERSRG